MFAAGDSIGSANPDGPDLQERNKFEIFLEILKAVRKVLQLLDIYICGPDGFSLSQVKNAERPFTLILDDPLANSYVQNLYAPDPDPNMEIESFVTQR